jgi:putative CRISPR-associated protein (TIGR02619 family)
LLSTDTWLGEEAAKLVAKWLDNHNLRVEVRRQADLQTSDLAAFQLALSELVHWSEETLPRFHQSGYRVIFNLTGCFKSVQGFLQTLAMFYADEVVYIFETTPELMRIPRLPVRISAEEMIRDHISLFRRLALRLTVTNAEGVPETLLMQLDGQIALSPWGELVWQREGKRLYEQRVLRQNSVRPVFSMTSSSCSPLVAVM